MEDATPITIKDFRGRFDRGQADVCPPEYAISELNVEFDDNGVKSRAGVVQSLNSVIGGWGGVAVRVFEYKKKNEASRLLILDNTGKIWDSSTSMLVPILSIGSMTDFSATVIFDRAYITPHDGKVGLSNDYVYVYDGSGVARVAGGDPPTGFAFSVVDSANSGNIEAGNHLFAIAYETASGHITMFGTVGAAINTYPAPGGKKANISLVPIGPSYVVARWVICTGVITGGYSGNPNDYDWFFLPNGRIGDNVTTVLNDINFFDADLIDSAERLQNQLTKIPAGSCITLFDGRMVVGGEAANNATLRVSENAFPESISGLDGFVNVDPGDAGDGIQNLVEFRSSLYVLKDFRTYTTQDNGASPSTWDVTPIDAAIGSTTHGTAGILNSKGNTLDQFLVCSRTGLHSFSGSYGSLSGPDLTFIIANFWQTRINKQYFHKIQLAVDPIKKMAYVAIPVDTATEPNYLLTMNYSDGLTWDKVKWSLWQFQKKPTTCWVEVDFTTKETKFKFGSSEQKIYVISPSSHNDDNTAINAYYRPGFITVDKSGSVCYFKALRARVIGNGFLVPTCYGLDDTTVSILTSLTLASMPGTELYRLMDFAGERVSVKFEVKLINEWFNLTALRVFGGPLWDEAIQT